MNIFSNDKVSTCAKNKIWLYLFDDISHFLKCPQIVAPVSTVSVEFYVFIET